jgi:hypothetical protein
MPHAIEIDREHAGDVFRLGIYRPPAGVVEDDVDPPKSCSGVIGSVSTWIRTITSRGKISTRGAWAANTAAVSSSRFWRKPASFSKISVIVKGIDRSG